MAQGRGYLLPQAYQLWLAPLGIYQGTSIPTGSTADVTQLPGCLPNCVKRDLQLNIQAHHKDLEMHTTWILVQQ